MVDLRQSVYAGTLQGLPEAFQSRVTRELRPGETVRWVVQPRPNAFGGGAIGAFLFAIPWTAFAVFWICGASGFKLPDFSKPGFQLFFPMFGIPFVLIGIGMLTTPLRQLARSKRMVYLVTSQRAAVLMLGRRTSVRSFAPDVLGELERVERRDGSGDIVFLEATPSHSGREGVVQHQGFFRVPDAARVEALLRTLASEHRAK